MSWRSRTALALAAIPVVVLPLLVAVTVGARVPTQRTLGSLPASAGVDYDSRFSTGFPSLREAYLAQLLGLGPASSSGRPAAASAGTRPASSSHAPAFRDRLDTLPVGGDIWLSPAPDGRPGPVETWRSHSASMSADGARVAYLTSNPFVEGIDPTPCSSSPPTLNAVGAIRYLYGHNWPWSPQIHEGPCTQAVVVDTTTGGSQIASVNDAGEQANRHVWMHMLSGNGRFVVFTTDASNIVPGDDNQLTDVFVRDLVTQRTELITRSIHGGPIRGAWQNYPRQLGYSVGADAPDVLASVGAGRPSISHDGRFVAYESAADDLVAGDTPQSVDVFVRDRLRGATERVSVSSSGRPMSRADVERDNRARLSSRTVYSADPCMSPNGRYVVWRSRGSELVPGDRNGLPDLFLRDRLQGTTELITVSSSGAQQDGMSVPGWYPWTSPWTWAVKSCVSNDGRHVPFWSYSTNLVEGDTNETGDLFLRDRWSATTRRVSLRVDGSEARLPEGGLWGCFGTDPTCSGNPPPTGEMATLSLDGRFLVFQTLVSLDPDDPDARHAEENGPPHTAAGADLYVYDLHLDRLTRVDVRHLAGVQPVEHDLDDGEHSEMPGHVGSPVVSADGSLISFHTHTNADHPVHFRGGVHLFRWRSP